MACDLDVVLAVVSGETLRRPCQVVWAGGILDLVATPPPAYPAPRPDVRCATFIVAPSGEQLRQIGGLTDAGQVQPIVDQAFPLRAARQTYEVGMHRRMRGKVILTSN